MNPYQVVNDFEETIAEWAGAKYGVAVESGSAAIFLSCLLRQIKETSIPARTYPSVPCAILNAGGSVRFQHWSWHGIYELWPYKIYDGALRFRKGMYEGGLHCLSFHARKHLPIGRGGMILTDSAEEAKWLRLARFDGREPVDLCSQKEFTVIGWNMYMTPEEAARGLLLFSSLKNADKPDLPFNEQGYPDLSKSAIYTQGKSE